jgi:CheY-like chemotaxis protein
MDIMMPSMNGHEAMQTMREWEKEQNLPETPIVVLTAVVSEDCEKSFQSGCTAFLTKPFHLKKFLQTIRQATGRGMEDPLGEVVRRG